MKNVFKSYACVIDSFLNLTPNALAITVLFRALSVVPSSKAIDFEVNIQKAIKKIG